MKTKVVVLSYLMFSFISSAHGQANTSLSNLAATSVNQSIVPNSNAALDLGSPSLLWANSWAYAYNAQAIMAIFTYGTPMTIQNLSGLLASRFVSSDYPNGNVPANTLTLRGAAYDSSSQPTSKPLAVVTGNDGTADTIDTGTIFIQTGNKGGGTAKSGNIELYTGTATGSRGTIKFQDGSQGTVGNVWVSTDTAGSGHWAQARSPSGTLCGWHDAALAVNCQGMDPGSACPSGYTKRTNASSAAFCVAN